jgi:hypothetical protein
VRVAAVNSMGTGAYEVAEFVASGGNAIAPYDKPSVIPYGSVRLSSLPASEAVSVLESSSSVKVTFSAPSETHGSAISEYWIEWWDINVAPEVATVQVTNTLFYTNTLTHYHTNTFPK